MKKIVSDEERQRRLDQVFSILLTPTPGQVCEAEPSAGASTKSREVTGLLYSTEKRPVESSHS